MEIEDRRMGENLRGKDMRVFVDTGTNVITISRRQFVAFLDANLDLEYVEGPFCGLEVKLVWSNTTRSG